MKVTSSASKRDRAIDSPIWLGSRGDSRFRLKLAKVQAGTARHTDMLDSVIVIVAGARGGRVGAALSESTKARPLGPKVGKPLFLRREMLPVRLQISYTATPSARRTKERGSGAHLSVRREKGRRGRRKRSLLWHRTHMRCADNQGSHWSTHRQAWRSS